MPKGEENSMGPVIHKIRKVFLDSYVVYVFSSSVIHQLPGLFDAVT